MNVFFGKEGLTSTSANHYANIAQEMISNISEKLKNIKFYNVEVSSITGGDKKLMSIGNTSLDFIDEALKNQAEMNSLCAWFREAIKAKDAMLLNVQNTSLETWAKNNNIALPVYPSQPARPKYISENDIMDSWDANKRNKYLRLEASAATYGKFIHPEGAYSRARKLAYNVASNPIVKEGEGRDIILYYRELSIPEYEIDMRFLQLQNKYREYEKELNCMKAELRESVNKANIELENEYLSAMTKYKEESKNYQDSYTTLDSEYQKWRVSERERISNLKIIIPKDLVDVFNKVKQ